MKWKTYLWLIATIAAVSTEYIEVENKIKLLNTSTTTTPLQQELIRIQDNEILGDIQVLPDTEDTTDNNVTTTEINDDMTTTTQTDEDTTSTDSNEITTTATATTVTAETTVDDTEPTGTSTLKESMERSVEVQDLDIETKRGPVRGIMWPGSNDIHAYLDIPYGQFVSNFAAPNETETWEEIFQASEHTKRCPQLDGDVYVGETDCLTLSIFTPANALNTSVLFYIHESDFNFGNGDPAIYGPEYLVPKNVILVLPNYRLGPLGFLCLRNETAPGNAGLKDLALALQWTENNIEAFGGNPSNIAVGGDGTSAALAGYLALSPDTRHIVKKVISDSGSVLAHWAIDRDPISTAQKLVDSISNITIEAQTKDQTAGHVLVNTDIEQLLISAKDIQTRPCIEIDGFLTDTPWNILQNENIETVFIIGSANHAGLVEALQHDEKSIAEVKENFAAILPNDLEFDNINDRDTISEKLRNQYFKDGNITLEHSEALSLYHTDASYLGPSVRVARALIEAGATVYLYEFSFMGLLNRELVSIEDAPSLGAIRGDIAGYLFAQDGRAPGDGTNEKLMVELVGELWVNFLQTREPASSDFTWEPLNTTGPEAWLAIGEETQLETGSFHQDRLNLWSEIYRDHFIDRNTAFGLAPGKIMVAVTFAYCINFFKLI